MLMYSPPELSVSVENLLLEESFFRDVHNVHDVHLEGFCTCIKHTLDLLCGYSKATYLCFHLVTR